MSNSAKVIIAFLLLSNFVLLWMCCLNNQGDSIVLGTRVVVLEKAMMNHAAKLAGLSYSISMLNMTMQKTIDNMNIIMYLMHKSLTDKWNGMPEILIKNPFEKT